MNRIETRSPAFDIDAREAVTMNAPRIAPLAEQDFTEEAHALVEQMRGIFGTVDTSSIPDIFGILFKHPGLFRCNLGIGAELVGKGLIPPRERELVILRVGWIARSPFEWGEHVEAGKRCGLTAEEIERATVGSDAPGWSEHDRAVLRGTEELIGDHSLSDETWAVLAKSWNEAQLMELPGLVGGYSLTAMLYNTLRFDLLEGNPGLRRR